MNDRWLLVHELTPLLLDINSTIACLVHQNRVAWKIQWRNKIMLSFVILKYVTLFRLNLIRYPIGKDLCVVLVVVSLTKLCIHIYYHVMIIIRKNLNTKSKMYKIEVMMKCLVANLKHIRVL